MVGFCGIAGEVSDGIGSVTESVVWSDREHGRLYKDDRFEFFVSTHRSEEASSQPARTNDGRLIGIWGDLIGHEADGNYTPRTGDIESDATYCAQLVDEHGSDFVRGLNSEFAGVVYDPNENRLTVFTDRLSARPVYVTETIEGAFLFSTHPRTILAHPSVDPTLDDELLVEFLTFERVFGTKTPFRGLTQVHPGSTLTYDAFSDETTEKIYWSPRYSPVDWSYREFVQTFASLYRRSVVERRSRSEQHGILISGGSDSRLLLGSLGRNVSAFHMNESMNKEANLARQISEVVGSDFTLLKRSSTYQSDVLSNVSGRQLYTSFFDQAHAVGFDSALSSRVDSIFSGHYSDVIFSGHYAPEFMPRIPVLNWDVPLPIESRISTIDQYIEYMLRDHTFSRLDAVSSPGYLKTEYVIPRLLTNHISRDDTGINHHGTRYPSFAELVQAGGFYPLTNGRGYFFYYTLNQTLPAHTPYLDNRLIDLALSMPPSFRLRRNVVNASLRLNHPELARIPHADTELPLSMPEVTHRGIALLSDFSKKVGVELTPGGGAWSDHDEVIRQTDIVPKYLLDRNLKDCWHEIDPSEVRRMYEAHLDGESHFVELYGLLSLCHSYPFCSEGCK